MTTTSGSTGPRAVGENAVGPVPDGAAPGSPLLGGTGGDVADVAPGSSEPAERSLSAEEHDGPVLLGPLLRHVDSSSATVWVETARRGEVVVRAGGVVGRDRTVTVGGHHYALVVVEGLAPGVRVPYVVELDGERAWPLPDDPRPAPTVRPLPAADGATPRTGGAPPLRIALGSCRVDRPMTPPFTRTVEEDPEGVGVDALVALSTACQAGRELPDLLLLLGDQVYADEGLSPHLRERIAGKRGDAEPRGEVADFEEYTWLYRESWSDPEVRWLLATTPTAMIFDDHDVRDDWNTSRAWREGVQRLPWWRDRICGAYASYWLHQHLGNLMPARLAEDDLWARVREVGTEGDAGDVLREFALAADEQIDGGGTSEWSYVRDLGRTRLVVVDTRSGRVLSEERRSMLDEQEWADVEQHLTGDVDHLLVAASLPVLLEPALHDLELWNAETASAGAWGERFRPHAEAFRQAVDLEHWGAFESSFHRLVDRLGEVAAGRLGRAPSSVLLLSGDVHHGYVAPLRYPPERGVRSPVVQLVSSPLRNALPAGLPTTFRFLHTAPARLVGRLLRRSVGVPPLAVSWRSTTGPMFGNGFATLELSGPSARVVFEKAEPGRGPGTDCRRPDDVRLRRDVVMPLA
ncbi:alkaline phosphatase D family protein [uncultured Pseudokineococcus sp.]|uniref:alkaline phosphatase D family protein n=1 Tax=uncultured Pseudokineococcus sp. TaxID=1642928 RepID=UPI002616E13A|nr:alkaline phosphatase D family protein [uncultured Pseudokineococcus sp.]